MGITTSKSRETLIFDEKQFYFGAIKMSGKEMKASGTGKFYSEDGSMYIGKFKNHRFNGLGTMYYSGGNIYIGNWHENSRHGEGKLYFYTGERYEGEFLLDEIHGNGIFYYNDGARYEGEFILGVKNGFGKYFNSANNLLYHGEFSLDMFNGKGNYYYENGNVLYEGNWKNSLAHGIGTLYDVDGNKYFYGYFNEGEPIYQINEEDQGFNSNYFGEYNFNYNFPNMNKNNFNKESIRDIIKENPTKNIPNIEILDLSKRNERVTHLNNNFFSNNLNNNKDNNVSKEIKVENILNNVIHVRDEEHDITNKPILDTSLIPNQINLSYELGSTGRFSVPKPIDRKLLNKLNDSELKEKVSVSNPILAVLKQDKDVNKKSFLPMQIKNKNQIISINDDKVRKNPYYEYISITKKETQVTEENNKSPKSPKNFFDIFKKNKVTTVIEPIKNPKTVEPPKIPYLVTNNNKREFINPLENITNVKKENNIIQNIDNTIKLNNPLSIINK